MRHRKGRSALTAAGIVLGVAIFFGVLVANATSQVAVQDFVDRITGRADVVGDAQGAFGSGMPAGAADEVAALPGVEHVSPSYAYPTELLVRGPDGHARERAFITGVDLEANRHVFDHELATGRFFEPGASEIVLGTDLAEQLDVAAGDRVSILATGGRSDVAVVGILEDSGVTGFGPGGSVGTVLTSIQTAWAVNGQHDVYTGLAVVLADDTDVTAWIDAHDGSVLGVSLLDASSLAQGFQEFLRVFGTVLTFFATIALFVGGFLIYLTLSMAVVERTRTYGTLRALGASRRQVRRVVLTEALTLGVVSTAMGLLVGLLLALGLLLLISALFSIDISGLTVPGAAVVASVLVGLVVTAVAAFLPARRAARLSPVEAMRGDHAAQMRLGRGWIVGVALLVLSVGARVGPVGLPEALSSLAVVGILLGAILVVPLVLRPLAAILGRLTRTIAPGVGSIAVLHLVRERSRSAYTLGLIMIVMAMLFSTGGLFLSVRAGIDDLIDRQFGGDAFVGANAPMPPEVRDALLAHPDVVDASPLAFGHTTVQGAATPGGDEVVMDDEHLILRMVEPEAYFRISGLLWTQGNDADALGAFERGRAVALSESAARAHGSRDRHGSIRPLERGGTLVLDTRQGPEPFEIIGIFTSPPGPPIATISLDDGTTYFGADRAMAYVIDIRDGADDAVVAASIEADHGPTYALEVETADTAKAEARSIVLQFFRIIYAILGVAAVVGLLGLANTLAMSVLQRFREIGILRAVGVTRSQTWRMVLVESATMGLTAFVLSAPLGFLLTSITIGDMSGDFAFSMPTVYPWVLVPFVALFALTTTVLAAWAPGRRASRLEVVGALQYE